MGIYHFRKDLSVAAASARPSKKMLLSSRQLFLLLFLKFEFNLSSTSALPFAQVHTTHIGFISDVISVSVYSFCSQVLSTPSSIRAVEACQSGFPSCVCKASEGGLQNVRPPSLAQDIHANRANFEKGNVAEVLLAVNKARS